jgi:hypothetical protein
MATMACKDMERLSSLLSIWGTVPRALAPPGLEPYNKFEDFSNLFDLEAPGAPKLLIGGLGTVAPRVDGWPVQELGCGEYTPDLHESTSLFGTPMQVKNPEIVSLSEWRESHGGKSENRKAPPSRESQIPMPSFCECASVRSQRFASKKRDLFSQYSQHVGPIVTLMICNIPCRITLQQLVEVIDSMGFAGKYDFLHLPIGGGSSAGSRSNLGYGFINFADPVDAEPFRKAFMNYQFEGTSSAKVCTVRPAHIQGLENNILHFDRSAAKARSQRGEGPFIRQPVQKVSDYQEETTSTQAPSGMDDFSPSCVMQDLSWLEPSYFDFLDESPDFIVCGAV